MTHSTVLLLALCILGASANCIEKDVHLEKLNDNPSEYTNEQLLAHLGELGKYEWANDLETTFRCVDARGTAPQFGTPGGDFSEFLIGLTIYFELTDEDITFDTVLGIFTSFVNHYITPQRKFYFHSDETRIGYLLDKMGVEEFPTSLDPEEKEIWLAEIVNSTYQGCGHVRFTLENPTAYDTPLILTEYLIQSFFTLYWDNVYRYSLLFVIKEGPLNGKALLRIAENGTECHSTPLATPFLTSNDQSVFINHDFAIDDYRKSVLVPFFVSLDASLDEAEFYEQMNTLFETTLTQTATRLLPNSPFFRVTIDVEEEELGSSNGLLPMLLLSVVSILSL